MANRIRAKDILRLDGSGLSGRAIAASLGVSRNSVTAGNVQFLAHFDSGIASR